MYPSNMLDPAATSGSRSQSNDARLLLGARDESGAIFMPIKVQHCNGADSEFQLRQELDDSRTVADPVTGTWAESFKVARLQLDAV
jgi:hypothetical protein